MGTRHNNLDEIECSNLYLVDETNYLKSSYNENKIDIIVISHPIQPELHIES